jgi:hypothetical protein
MPENGQRPCLMLMLFTQQRKLFMRSHMYRCGVKDRGDAGIGEAAPCRWRIWSDFHRMCGMMIWSFDSRDGGRNRGQRGAARVWGARLRKAIDVRAVLHISSYRSTSACSTLRTRQLLLRAENNIATDAFLTHGCFTRGRLKHSMRG